MQQSLAATEQRRRGRPFEKGTSGNPLGQGIVNERARELFAAVAPDFGELSATDELLLRQATRLLARAERTRDVDAGIRMSGEARRIIQSLQKRKPAPRQPTLKEHLAQRAAKAAEGTSEVPA